MERVAVQVDGSDLGVGHLDLVGIAALVEAGVDLKAGAGTGTIAAADSRERPPGPQAGTIRVADARFGAATRSSVR
jgi:hypothetical protein